MEDPVVAHFSLFYRWGSHSIRSPFYRYIGQPSATGLEGMLRSTHTTLESQEESLHCA